MKNLTILSLCLLTLSSQTSYSQSKSAFSSKDLFKAPFEGKQIKAPSPFKDYCIPNFSSQSKNKPSGNAYRLIAISEKEYSGGMFKNSGDSTHVFWHGNNNLSYDFSMLYTSFYNNPYSTNAVSNPNDNLLKVDSLLGWSTSSLGGSYSYLNSRELVNFDVNGNPIQQVDKRWNGSSWVDSFKTDYQFNNGLVISEIYQEWAGSGWLPDNKDEYMYDGLSRLISHTNYYYDASSTSFIPQDKFQYNYTSNNDVSEIIYQTNSGGTLVNYNKVSILYNANNKIISETYLDWTGGVYVPDTKYEYVYDAMNRVIKAYLLYYDDVASLWDTSTRIDFNLNSNGLILQKDNKTYDASTGTFSLSYSQFMTYSGTGKLTSATSANWDASTSSYNYNWKTILEYNSNDQLSSANGQTYSGGSWVNFDGDEIANYYYESFTGLKDLNSNTAFTIYPNPAKSTLDIVAQESIQSVYIIDAVGRVVYKLTSSDMGHHATVDVCGYTNGNYFIMTTTKSGKGVKQFSVLH